MKAIHNRKVQYSSLKEVDQYVILAVMMVREKRTVRRAQSPYAGNPRAQWNLLDIE